MENPKWIAIKEQCTSPGLLEKFNTYTIQLANGYMGLDLAIYYMEEAIKKSINPYIGKTVVELIKLRAPVQDALYAYPYPEEPKRTELVRTLNQIIEAERVATKEKNFGV
tara:strand:- start:211 stop:540 length:330 start_codon:yes stop_codon:yes gene_type:complete